MSKTPQKSIRRQSASTTRFRGVLHAVDMLLKTMTQPSPERTLLRFLRKHAVGVKNAKCWQEIEAHLHEWGHHGYTQRHFQMGWLQICRRIGCFICSYTKGFYLPDNPEDYDPYEFATTKRIKGQQANLQRAMTLRKQQEEHEAIKRSRRTNTRTTAKRAGANRPTATKSPRKARSKGR